MDAAGRCQTNALQNGFKQNGREIRWLYNSAGIHYNGTVLKSALMNDLLLKHPMNGVRYTKPVRAVDDIKYLTIEEQQIFLDTAKRSRNYPQFALVLKTGFRTGELIGLTWDAIDWEKLTLIINKTLEYRRKQGHWRAGPPMIKQSYPTIALTTVPMKFLSRFHTVCIPEKSPPTLLQRLEYIDRRTGAKEHLVMHDLVFVNWRTGEPTKNSSYDTHLCKLCDEAEIKRFCTHALRHTYARRAIERGMQPNVLQKLLGDLSIKTRGCLKTQVMRQPLFHVNVHEKVRELR